MASIGLKQVAISFCAVAAMTFMTLSSPSAAIGGGDEQLASTPRAQASQSTSLDFNVYSNWCVADETQPENWQVQLGYCLGYLQGLYWGQVIGSPVAERPFCLPPAFQKTDMVAALSSYASKYPMQVAGTMTADQTARHVAEAFKTYFECE